MEIGENSFFLGIARFLWAFNLEKSIDAIFNVVTPNAEDLVGGLAASLREFPVRIVPRSGETQY